MPARAMSSATVSFGLVSIPVKLYSTSDSSSYISLNWIHEKCGTRVQQRFYCPTDDELVDRGDLVKGYEYTKGQYVLFTDEELKGLAAKSTYSIDITQFVPLSEVDPIYFEKSYYLGPGKGGDRPYRLLAEAMRMSERAALARYAARGKSYLVLLRPFQDGLIMQQLRYVDEIRSFDEVPVGEAEVKGSELELALKLIEQIASDSFEPEGYEDEVRQQLWQLIESKVEGKELTTAPSETPKAQIVDLMEALKASLGDGDEGRKPAKRTAGKAAAKKGGKSKAKSAAG